MTVRECSLKYKATTSNIYLKFWAFLALLSVVYADAHSWCLYFLLVVGKEYICICTYVQRHLRPKTGLLSFRECFHLPLHTGSTTDWDLLAPSRVFGLIWSQDSGLRLCYGLDSASLYLSITMLKSQFSIPQSVTMLSDKVFEEVIKLKRDC